MVVLPKAVAQPAAEQAILIDFRTPRALVAKAIEATYPGIRREHIHVWTLGGKSRASRIATLWKAWQEQGVHVVEDGWTLPGGLAAFTESGTYAPTYRVGTWMDEAGERHLFISDGYAASAEAVQTREPGADARPRRLDGDVHLAVRPALRQGAGRDAPRPGLARLRAADPGARRGASTGRRGRGLPRVMIREATEAGLLTGRLTLTADDFFPEKRWEMLAVSGYMGPDPYSGAPGVKEVSPGVYRATVRLAAPSGDKRITLTLRLAETLRAEPPGVQPAAQPLPGEGSRSRRGR